MKQTGVCPKCTSPEVLTLREITDQIGATPAGLTQDAWVCATCGFIEFYASNLQELQAVAERQRKPRTPFR